MDKREMNHSLQMSETIRLGVILALSGGFMDAYSYIVRDYVFANAQTGNMLLFGIYLSEGEFHKAVQYFLPILFFAIGIIIAESVRSTARKLHWRQIAVLVEVVILIGVAFIPLKFNLIANSLISFACGIQVESFRKIHGNGIATTMCIGNLRSGTQNLIEFIETGDGQRGKKAVLYYGIIVSFVMGAILGNVCIKQWHEKAIVVSAVIMMAAFVVMFYNNESSIKAQR